MTASGLKNILIIDDDAQSIFLLRHILEKKGYQVMSAISGNEGLKKLESFKADLLLLDIIMPEMDGYQVCKKMKLNPDLQAIPVIFITASNDPDELIHGFEAGAVDFISKPFNKSELLARVNTHLELKNSRDIIFKNNKILREEIEKRKQTEEKFKALSEMTFEAVVFIKDDIIVEANKAAVELLKLNGQSKDEVSLDDFISIDGKRILSNIYKSKEPGPWEVMLSNTVGKDFFAMIHHCSIKYMEQDVDVLAIRDITRQKELDKEIFNAILETEEKERKRFSRDMHDGLGALLSTLKIYLNLLQKDNKSMDERNALLEEMKQTINQAIATARTIANDLMPSVLMDYGLIKALEVFTDALIINGVIQIQFKHDDIGNGLDEKTQTHIYRIVLELINNTLKHAQATTITINLKITYNTLTIDYIDNGKGFVFDKIVMQGQDSQGLKNIFSRINFLNGKGQYHTELDYGLRFTMEIPV